VRWGKRPKTGSLASSSTRTKTPSIRKALGHFFDTYCPRSGNDFRIVSESTRYIYGICSDFGSHRDPPQTNYPPSRHTVNAVVSMLCDTILWFDVIMEKL
jgi:hypothetical protein